MRILIILSLVSLTVGDKMGTTVTRTQLHVARSLDPLKTETRLVRTRSGDVVSLLVRKRDGRRVGDLPPPDHPANAPKATPEKPRAQDPGAAVPGPVDVRSGAVYVKPEAPAKRGKTLYVDHDGVPVVTGVRVPDDEEDKKYVWRNARVIDGVLVPNEKRVQTSQTVEEDTVPKKEAPTNIQWLRMEPITKPIVNPTQQTWYRDPAPKPVTPSPDWPQYTQDAIKVIDYSPGSEANKYYTEKILEYIRHVNKQELNNRQYGLSNDLGRDSRGLREQPQIQSRILHTPGATVYPTSLLYTPTSSQSGKVRVEEGVRTPVLQYAHPELGVQSAKVEPELEEGENVHFSRDQALAYFAHDIHSDRSPYAFEPGLEDEARVEDFPENSKRSNTGYNPGRPKKTLSYFHRQNGLGHPGDGKYPGKPVAYEYRYKGYDSRPFWEKMTDSIKEHVEYGMEKVQHLTRPVVEPLVEATHKISENLGFNPGTRGLNGFKEKLGMAGSGSMILPAIGLVAGGAALGLGAVAVGRFLDVDMLKRSNPGANDREEELQMEHKRALEALAKGIKRSKRSLMDTDEEMALQRLEDSIPAGPSIDANVWGRTSCAKKVFCQVVSSRTDDEVDFMEKKMSSYLMMLHPSMTQAISHHLDDVMSAIRRKDCSVFICQEPTGS